MRGPAARSGEGDYPEWERRIRAAIFGRGPLSDSRWFSHKPATLFDLKGRFHQPRPKAWESMRLANPGLWPGLTEGALQAPEAEAFATISRSEQRREAGGGEVLVVGEGVGQAEAAHDGEGDAIDDPWVAGATGLVGGPSV